MYFFFIIKEHSVPNLLQLIHLYILHSYIHTFILLIQYSIHSPFCINEISRYRCSFFNLAKNQKMYNVFITVNRLDTSDRNVEKF